MDGFREFFEEHFPAVTRALAVAVNDPMEAEELAQEAFARALRRWGDVRHLDRPAAWVYVVAIREHGHRSRRSQRETTVEIARSERDAGADAEAEFARLIKSLPPRQRTAVVLRFHADLSLAEIAEAMGCAVGTVKATLHAALQRLRVDLDATTELEQS